MDFHLQTTVSERTQKTLNVQPHVGIVAIAQEAAEIQDITAIHSVQVLNLSQPMID